MSALLSGPVHLIAIGGAGMSAVARLLLARGVGVTGSDAADSATLAALRELGATTFVGHDAAHLGDAAAVVVSTAIRETNPELVEARRRGLPVLHRAEALAELAAGRRVVAVAGTHGKTTTSSMVAVALRAAGADPSFAIGGDLRDTGTNAHLGGGGLFVIEADESDGSFLRFTPEVAVVTNVEPEHLDHWGSDEAVAAAFAEFAARATSCVVTCADDPGARELTARLRSEGHRVLTYGAAGPAAPDLAIRDLVQPAGGGSRFTADAGAWRLDVELAVTGHHYVLDAAAAILACAQVVPGWAAAPGVGAVGGGAVGGGAPTPHLAAAEALRGFGGAKRRMEEKGRAGGVRVVDSYAHHQTEVAADLAAARQLVGPGRILAVFQPHLYSRTQAFGAQIGAALGAADEVVVLDVYGAREDPVPGVTGRLVADAVPLPRERVHFAADRAGVAALVASITRPGDLLLTLGAGDVTTVGPAVLELLEGAGT